jgi:predicted nucleic acid-binding protein
VSAVVVDTDIVSFLFKDHAAASLYQADLTGKVLVISFMTVAELERWPIQAKWGQNKRDRLMEYLRPFAVMPWDRALCTRWAEVMTGAQAKGYRIDCADAWIAATALQYGLPLVSHNRDDYRGVSGLTVICQR